MAYKKPQIVAKSAPKQNFVGPCPVKTVVVTGCGMANYKCDCGPLK